MKPFKTLLFITIAFALVSCQRSETDDLLLKTLIKHYSVNPADSLKLEAAKFLIKNLKGQPTLDTITVASNQVYFDLIYNTWKKEKMRVGFRLPIQTRVIDSINKADDLPQTSPHAYYIDDAKLVTADFIIKNIDDAFYAWQTMPWSRHIKFEEFCNSILPYRSSTTYSLDARRFFLDRYRHLADSLKTDNPFIAAKYINDDISKWFAEDVGLTSRYPYLQPIKFSNLIKGKFGDCQDAQSVRIAALRAMGIPAVMDELPGWGNSDMQHFWFKIVDPIYDTVKTKINNRNIPGSTQHVITSSSFDDPDFGEYPKNIAVVYGRSVPKVYRRCFAKQATSLATLSGPDDNIPIYFKNAWIKDVSAEYLDCSDVAVQLKDSVPDQKFVYLCTFDNQQWRPIAWAYNKRSTALFKAMGKNIVYLPAYYKDNTLIPAASPFLLDQDGKTKPIGAANSTETIKIYAKFPVRTYVLTNEHAMVGGRFQLSNRADLSDTVTVHTVTKTPFYKTEVKINENKKFRFLIFQFKGIPVTQMSELTFYGLNKEGKEIELHGEPIGSKGSLPYETPKLFDGIRANYFKSAKEDPYSFVGIDLGRANATKIARIVYIPHSDDNNVAFNDHYELYYWDKRWISIGLEAAAEDNTVTFNKVPKNALLLVKDTDGGVEERMFRYKNGQQEFW